MSGNRRARHSVRARAFALASDSGDEDEDAIGEPARQRQRRVTDEDDERLSSASARTNAGSPSAPAVPPRTSESRDEFLHAAFEVRLARFRLSSVMLILERRTAEHSGDPAHHQRPARSPGRCRRA